MAKFKASVAKKNSSILKVKLVAEKIHRSLMLGRKLNCEADCGDDVPGDVKEGHFAVVAVYKSQVKRFVVALDYLTHPRFLKLLEKAAEEYGFDREGALTIPCPPSELEKIIDDEQW